MPRARPGPLALVLFLSFGLGVVGVTWFVGSSARSSPPSAPASGTATSLDGAVPSGQSPFEDTAPVEAELARKAVAPNVEPSRPRRHGPDSKVATQPDVRFCGQLVDADSGEGLAGTVVPLAGKRKRSLVPTDPWGRFAMTGRSSQLPFARADAEGYAPTIFGIREGHSDPNEPCLVRLFRTAILDVSVRDTAGVPITGAEVEISTDAYELQETTPTDLDFYSGPDPTWTGTTDPAGHVVIEAVAPRAALRIAVSAHGWPPRIEPQSFTLLPGERRSIELVLGAGASILGRLEDSSGKPIPRWPVWIVQARANLPTMFKTYDSPVATTKTDGTGRFRFDSVPAAAWWIGPAPSNAGSRTRRQKVPERRDVPPVGELVVVDGETSTMEIVVRVECGLYLRGRVLNPTGQPVDQAAVHAHRIDSMAFEQGSPDERGEFSIGPVASGTWSVSASPYDDRLTGSESHRLEAGRSDVVLTLRPGASIHGVVVDAGTGQQCESELSMVFHGSDGESWWPRDAPDGRVDLFGLAPGTYSIAATTRDGRTGVLHGVTLESGQRIDGIRVEVTPGAKLRLSYDGPEEYLYCDLHSEGSSFQLVSFASGKTATVIVPAGPIEVRWHDEWGEATDDVETITMQAGDERELVLKPGD